MTLSSWQELPGRVGRQIEAFPRINSAFFKLLSKTPRTTTLQFFGGFFVFVFSVMCNVSLWVEMSDIFLSY